MKREVRILELKVRNISSPCCFFFLPALFTHHEPGMRTLSFKFGSFGFGLEFHVHKKIVDMS